MNDLVISGEAIQYGFFKAARIVSGAPQYFRQARKPDGQIVIQGGYVWHEGFASGIEWKELPIVDVDENGNEISVDAGGAA
jgi:hypothetical protein